MSPMKTCASCSREITGRRKYCLECAYRARLQSHNAYASKSKKRYPGALASLRARIRSGLKAYATQKGINGTCVLCHKPTKQNAVCCKRCRNRVAQLRVIAYQALGALSPRPCQGCHTTFTPTRLNQKFCTPYCRLQA